MYCSHCGAELTGNVNFCPYCGTSVQEELTTAIALSNKAVSTAAEEDEYNLVLVSCGTCNKTTVGDLLEDIFGYTDSESTNLIKMVPVVVGQNLTATEAGTVAQMLTEYGAQVSVTNENDQYVDLTQNANRSIFDSNGNLIKSAIAIIGALTVANRITSYKRYKKPSLIERLFKLQYEPEPPAYRRNFRPHLDPQPLPERRTIRKPPQARPGRVPVVGVHGENQRRADAACADEGDDVLLVLLCHDEFPSLLLP